MVMNPHVKLSVSLEEEVVRTMLGRGKRSKQISEAIEALLTELEGSQ